MLYNSNSFFELFSSDFKSTYAYLNVNIGDEQLRAIYDEFLKNVGTRYLMDHSNLKYDECMDYYDCSSWVIHCLAHSGVKKLPDLTAAGIYTYCEKVEIDKGEEKLLELKWVTLEELKDIDLRPSNIKDMLINEEYLKGLTHIVKKS